MARPLRRLMPSCKKRVLEGGEPIICRPADNLLPEMDKLAAELEEEASADDIRLAECKREGDV